MDIRTRTHPTCVLWWRSGVVHAPSARASLDPTCVSVGVVLG